MIVFLKKIWPIVILILGGCIPKPLDVQDITPLKSRMVVASQAAPGQSLAVLLTKSIGALDAGSGTDPQLLLESVAVHDAVVTVTYSGKVDTLQYVGLGVYASVAIPMVDGRKYFLKAVSPTLGTITASAVKLPEVTFKTVYANLDVVGNDTLATVKYSFIDPPGKNWYMVDFQRFRAARDPAKFLNPRIFVKLAEDSDISTPEYNDTFTVPFRRFSDGDTVAVSLTNISEEYYQYLKVRQDNSNDLSSLVSEPLNLPTNVKNGYGYFNLQVQDARAFIMKP